MKRILSIILCVSMLASMVAMSVSAGWLTNDEGYEYGDLVDRVTTENIMTFTLDKDRYEAGDTVKITAAMQEIWGDPALEGPAPSYHDDGDYPGAYGMALLQACVIYDNSIFTAKAHESLASSSEILNFAKADIKATDTRTAKNNGAYNVMATAPELDADGNYGNFNGSGDMWTYNLTIAKDTPDGAYYLPVGPYVKTVEGGTFDPVIKFDGVGNENLFGWNGLSTSFMAGYNVGCTYITNCEGKSFIAEDAPAGAAEYECAYIKVIVGDYVEVDTTEQDKAAAAEVDALINAIPTTTGFDGTYIDAVNYSNLYAHNADANINGGNFSVKYKFIPEADDDGFGYIGGTTSANAGHDTIFWNSGEKKFQIGKVNTWNACTETVEVLAESPVMDLPAYDWTDVEYIYNGSYMAVKVNGEIVCETSSANNGYSFYIFYPSSTTAYIKDLTAGGVDYMGTILGAAEGYYNKTVDLRPVIGADAATARAAYEALPETAVQYVENLAALEAAEAIFAEYNQEKADVAINAIAAIPEFVLYNDACRVAIEAAEAEVAKLNETQLALVSNYDVLTAARAEYERQHGLFDAAKAAEVDALIDTIGEVTFEDRDLINNARAAYEALNDDQKALVTKLDVLVAAEDAYLLYGPVMEAEKAITNLGTEFFQGVYVYKHFVSDNGYSDIKVTGNNTTGDFTFNFDFVYTAANTSGTHDSGIALMRNNGSYVGYSFTKGGFVIARGGWFWSGNVMGEVDAFAEYELVPGRAYNMEISFAGTTATIKLDGEVVLTGTPNNTDFGFVIFYPQNVDLYVGDATLTSNEGTSNDPIKWDGNVPVITAGIDVLAPVNMADKLAATEELVAGLSDEQYALLADSYKNALAAAKADIEAKVAELQTAADAVEVLIAAIATQDDIVAAQAAFAALLPGAQTLVENYADLQNANALIVKGMIANLGEITPDSANAIVAAENAYGALTNDEKALVDNYATLTAARKELNTLNAAVANAEAVINMLQAGGSAIVNNADPSVGAYSQFLDNGKNLEGGKANAEYAFSFDIYVDSITDPANGYFGGSSENEVFVGYDMIRKTVFVAKAGPWGYNSSIDAANIVAEVPFELELQKWYDFKFVMGEATAQIFVDGELVLETAITEPSGWFIYYPKSIVSYYDNVEFWYNGEKQTSMSQFSKVEAGNWTAMGPNNADPGYYLTANAPVGPIDADADLIAAAEAAYAAVPAKAQYAVKNYGLIAEAKKALEDAENNKPVEDAQATIDALEVPAATYKNYADVLAAEDAIVAAKAAYDALTDEQKALVDTAELDAALKAFNKALIYDAALNGGVAPSITAVGGEGNITITWDAIDNATKYWVYVDGIVVATTANNEITVKASAGTHNVKVAVALNVNADLGSAATYVSGTSAEVAVDVAAVPGTVLNAAATATENSITATWDAIDGAIYYVTYTVGDKTITFKVAGTTHTLAKYVTANTAYTVEVKALVKNATGNYDVTAEVVEGVTAEKAFKVVSTENDVITWTAVEGATIYWVEISNGTKTQTIRFSGDVTSYNAARFVGEYTVTVKAYVAGQYFATDAVAFNAQ